MTESDIHRVLTSLPSTPEVIAFHDTILDRPPEEPSESHIFDDWSLAVAAWDTDDEETLEAICNRFLNASNSNTPYAYLIGFHIFTSYTTNCAAGLGLINNALLLIADAEAQLLVRLTRRRAVLFQDLQIAKDWAKMRQFEIGEYEALVMEEERIFKWLNTIPGRRRIGR